MQLFLNATTGSREISLRETNWLQGANLKESHQLCSGWQWWVLNLST